MDNYGWEEFLHRLGKRGEPADFKAFLSEFMPQAPVDPEAWVAMYPMICGDDVAKTMLATALQLPPAEAKRTVSQIFDVLPRANFRKRLNKELSRQQRDWHQQAIGVIRFTVIPGTWALEATFRAYIQGDYDLEQDPNELIQEANGIVEEDEEQALALVGEAGALALRGKDVWDRWSEDGTSPLDSWSLVLNTFVDRLQSMSEIYPLGPIEEERSRWEEILRRLEEKPKPKPQDPEEETVDLEYGGQLFDELAPFLYAERPIRADLLAELPQPVEDYAELVVHSVRNWDTWDFSEPGTEDLLINMIAILGEVRYEDAIHDLVDVVAGTADSDLFAMAQEATLALSKIGEPALDQVLKFVEYSSKDAARVELAHTLAEIGADDARTFDVLSKLFEEVPWELELDEWRIGKADVAEALAVLGDERAIPLLEAALADPAAAESDREVIREALEDLGVEA